MKLNRTASVALMGGAALVVALAGCSNDSTVLSPQPSPGPIGLLSVIKIPNVGPQPGFDFDLGIVDAATETYYLADRTNKSIDIIDARTNTLTAQVAGYVGQFPSNAVSGPNGIEVVNNFLYTGDGDSTVKIIDIASRTIVKVLPTGGVKRADAIAYDKDDNIVIVTNKNEKVPFVSFINPTTQTIVNKTSIPSSQLDAVLYDPNLRKFLVSVTSTTVNPGGEIDAVDPTSFQVTARYPVMGCLPGGLALGPSGHLLVGCSGDAIAAGFPAQSLILDDATGNVLKAITEVGGSDEVTYNAGDGFFYTASRDMTSNGLATGTPTPVLGIIDAVNLTYVKSVPTSKNSKSVAADPKNNRVFVPLTDVPGPGVGVYGRSRT